MEKTIAFYIKALHRDFDHLCDCRLQEMGLTRGLLYFILYMGKHPGCSPGELAEALDFDAGHVTRSMEKLVAAGFAVRTRRTEDKRAVSLNLTDKGRCAFESSRRLFGEWDGLAGGCLTEQERKQLLECLGKIARERRRSQNDL